MRLLVLGGTVFVGRHVVAAALLAGHAVTIFHRGVSHPVPIAGVESLHGDRDGDVSALEGQPFDAVIDCSGYTPAQLERSGAVLAGHVAHYLFVSSRSVYRRMGPDDRAEVGSPLLEGSDGYGALKARSEEAIAALWPGRVTIVRPGLIVGPHDPTGRFTYWPLRLHRGGDVLAPGRPGRQVQCLDGRDLARWCVTLVEREPSGIHDAVGASLTMGDLLETMRVTTGGDARLHWVGDDVLIANDVTPWTEMPLWIPDDDPRAGGLMHGPDGASLAAGLSRRPIDETIRDTLRWALSLDAGTPRAVATMTAQHEQLLLMTQVVTASPAAP